MATREEVLWNCRSALAAAVGAENPDDAVVEALAGLLLGHNAGLTLGEVVAAGVAAGYPPGALLKALLRCQVFDLEATLGDLDADNKPADERMDALRALFAQYQDVQNRFIESFSEHYEHEAADARQRAERERDAELLAQLRGDWRRDGQVELFNYFRELQVPTTVPLDEIDGHYVAVTRTSRLAMVLAAGERGRVAFAPTRDNGRVALLELQSAKDDVLLFRVAGLRPHPQGQRRRLRVEVREDAPFSMRLPDGRQALAYVRDFSVIGMGLECTDASKLEPGTTLQCSGRLGPRLRKVDLDLTVTVRWRVEGTQGMRVGVELAMEPGTREVLDRLVREYEQEAIKALNLIAEG